MQYFFTTYLLFLIIFYKFTSKYIDLLLLAFVTFIISMYITYIYPRKFTIYLDKEYVVSGYNRIYADIIHFGLFIAAFYINTSQNINIYQILTSIILIFTYILCINAEKLYGVSKDTLYKLGCYSILIYLVYYIYNKNI